MQNKLLQLMKEFNISNKELAKEIGISKELFDSKLEGKTYFKCSEMYKISIFLDKSVEDIFLPSMYVNGTRNLIKIKSVV